MCRDTASTHIVRPRPGRAEGALAADDNGGAGPDLVMCHGANRTLLDWEPLVARLRDHARIVSYDLRGHGRSDPPPDGSHAWTDQISDLLRVVRAFGLKRPVVLGHSLGGMIATMYAAAGHPCRAVINLDGLGGGAPSLYPGMDRDVVHHRRHEQAKAYARALPDVYDPAAIRTALDRATRLATAFGYEPSIERASVLRSFHRHGRSLWTRRPGAQFQLDVVRAQDEWSVFEATLRLPCPALIVRAGTMPQLTGLPSEYAELARSLIAGIDNELERLTTTSSNVRCLTIPEATHLMHLQAVDQTASVIRDHLAC